MENLTSKLFTIFLSSFYILGIISAFNSIETIALISIFVLFSLGILFFNFDIKKSIVLFLIFLFGIIRVQNMPEPDIFLNSIDEKEITLTGNIISSKDIAYEKKRVRFYIKANEARSENKTYKNLNSKVLVYLNYENSMPKSLNLADIVEIKGKLKTPKPAKNPYQFDYKKYLYNNDCAIILYSDENNLKTLGEVGFRDNPKLSVLKYFDNLRNKIILKHSKYIKSPQLEILGGIVFGSETINPDDKIKENFKNSGLLHLLAASGLNVALIFGIWWYLCSIVHFPYNLSIILGALFIVFYCFMTGFPPSILRAGIMLLFVLFGKLIDRNTNSASLVFFAGFLILLFNPKMIFDIGFQLSFVVTFGLIATTPVIIDKFRKKEKEYKEKYKNEPELKKQFLYLFSPINLVSIVLVPFIAQLWVIPLQMHYFSSISPYSILSNICVVPFIGILSFLGFISSIFALIPNFSDTFTHLFDLIANPLLTLLINISALFSGFKHSIINTISLNFFQIFTYFSLILFLGFNIENNFKNKKQVLITIVLAMALFLSFIQIKNNNLEVVMFDVENADCFLIKTPKNKYIMIDTGKKPYKGISSYEAVVKKYLLNKRVKTLEALVLTHFDLDHAGCALEILKNHKVKLTIIQKTNDLRAKDILNYLEENKLNYKIAKNLETIYFEPDLTLKTITPKGKSDNESSIVELLTYKDKKFLFMADVGLEGYKTIKNSALKDIDILKVGHHGARKVLSDEMLNDLKPKYALISAGSNRYNHPDIETLKLLKDNNTIILSTKSDGFFLISAISKKTKQQKSANLTFKNYSLNNSNKLKTYDFKPTKAPMRYRENLQKVIEEL